MIKSIQIVGPYYTNYSYAQVNRELAIALKKEYPELDVYLWCSPDKIDWLPTESELKSKPEIYNLVTKEEIQTDVVLYNNFPKSLTEPHGFATLPGKIKIMYLAWEESVYPKNWVEEANNHLHLIITASKHVEHLLKDSGVKIPIITISLGVAEHIRKPAKGDYPLNTAKNFKFLHISTGKARKGVDVLIEAYNKVFTKDDDVTLVIKSSPNPDNLIDRHIEKFKKDNSPEIIHISDSTLTDEDISNLHETCDCGVYPSRAEGFGLPHIETALHNKPLIATNYSSYLDFFDNESAFLVDYELEYALKSEATNIGAKWAEPNVDDLATKMRFVFENYNSEEVKEKVKRGNENVQRLTWQNTAKNVKSFLDTIEKINLAENKNIAVITPINSQDGISIYSQRLYKVIENSFNNFYYLSNKDIADRASEDGENVVRTWSTGEVEFNETIDFINKNNIDIVHIQYHSGSFFPHEGLANLIQKLKGKKVFVTLHSVRGTSFDHSDVHNLADVNKLIVHNKEDYDYLIKKFSNTHLSELAMYDYPNRSKSKLKKTLGFENKLILSTHGLINKNKNIPNIIEAINSIKDKLPDFVFLSINALSANNANAGVEFNRMQELTKRYNLEDKVLFFTPFLDNQEIEILLQSSDIIILAYTEVGESASGAVRNAISSGNPVIVTDIKMFIEFDSEVYKISDESPDKIAKGILDLVNNKQLTKELVTNAKLYAFNNSPLNKAIEHINLYL